MHAHIYEVVLNSSAMWQLGLTPVHFSLPEAGNSSHAQ